MLVCGHYEGIDERVIEELQPEEISVGDYVLTGGELPALVLADSVTRLLPGVLSDAACFEEESHYNSLHLGASAGSLGTSGFDKSGQEDFGNAESK